MNRVQLVLLALKPKVKALGFNQKELSGIAAKIADNIQLEEEASEEEVSAEIDSQIEAILPFLQLGQSQANRVIEAWKKSRPTETDIDDDDEGQPGSKKSAKNEDTTPEWAKTMMSTIEGLTAKVVALEAEKSTTSRLTKLEGLLKDTGAFGERTIKSFKRMKFENEDEFDEFYSEVEADLKKLNQERADAGLSRLGAIPGAQQQKPQKEEVLTDDEIKALASGDF